MPAAEKIRFSRNPDAMLVNTIEERYVASVRNPRTRQIRVMVAEFVAGFVVEFVAGFDILGIGCLVVVFLSVLRIHWSAVFGRNRVEAGVV